MLSTSGRTHAGGFGTTSDSQGTAELYDFVRGRWRQTGSMIAPRAQHFALPLPDGKALVAGGIGKSALTLSSAELYGEHLTVFRLFPSRLPRCSGQDVVCWCADTFTGLFYATGSMITARSQFCMVQLPDGNVLAAGGIETPSGNATSASEIYDPSRGRWHATGSLNVPRGNFVMTVLPDGTVLAVGGSRSSGGAIASTEVYTPVTGSWALSASLGRPTEGAQAVFL